MRQTDWSDRIANISITATQVMSCLLIADALGWKPLEKLRELSWRWKRWEFDIYYRHIWPVKRRVESDDNHESD